jgi:hypothetical protein
MFVIIISKKCLFLGQITHGGGSGGGFSSSGFGSGGGGGGNVWVILSYSFFYNITDISLTLRLVMQKNSCLKPLAMANDIISDENIIKVCMLVQVIMVAVITVLIILITIHMVSR